MTTAHRPTFDAARGQNHVGAPTRQFASRSLPAHKVLKYRQATKEDDAKASLTDVKQELLEAEALTDQSKFRSIKQIQTVAAAETFEHESLTDRRLRLAMVHKDEDADYGSNSDGDSIHDESDDEEEELLKELEKIKSERLAEKQRLQKKEDEITQMRKDTAIAFGNPLLNDKDSTFTLKRRWNEDVVFRVKETPDEAKKDFINDLLRSDFHRSFIKKYVR